MKLSVPLLLALSVSLAFCLCITPPWDCTDSDGDGVCDKDESTTTIPSMPDDRLSCEAQGGIWGRVGPISVERCNLPTRDLGRPCSSQAECEGACTADLNEDERERAATGVLYKNGTCTAWRITTGCQAMVEDGRVIGVICLD